MAVNGIYHYSFSRFQTSTFGTEETFRIDFPDGPHDVTIVAAISAAQGVGLNKAGIAEVRGREPLGFGGSESWVNTAFVRGCTGFEAGLVSSGQGGCTGVFTVFVFG